MVTETLVELADRLNLLNLQIVAERSADQELAKVSQLVVQLRDRIAQCKQEMSQEFERLTAAKATCTHLLATIEAPVIKPASSTPTTAIAIPTLPLIEEEEFVTVPKYMKGRLTRDKINLGVEFFNRTLTEKYTLLRQNPSKLSVEQRQRFYELRDADSEETVGRYFITEQDMKSVLASNKGAGSAFKLDSTGRAILAIMRHLGRIKELRSLGIIRFMVV